MRREQSEVFTCPYKTLIYSSSKKSLPESGSTDVHDLFSNNKVARPLQPTHAKELIGCAVLVRHAAVTFYETAASLCCLC